jgi:hypothetical protein
MNRSHSKMILYAVLLLIFAFLLTRCATVPDEGKAYPKNHVFPLTEINPEKVFEENRGMKVEEANATMSHDYYRGGVQEKDEAERLMQENRWEEAREHFIKSNRYLRTLLKYLSEDEAYYNIYGDHNIIFLPNLLVADNSLKLIILYKKTGAEQKIPDTKNDCEYYLSESLKSAKTEWALQIKKALEDEFLRK